MKDQKQIITKILEGETELFRLLVDYYHNRIFVLIRGFVHQVQDAEDLTQETFINAFVALGSFKGNSEFSTWLYRIAINTTYSFLRKRPRSIINERSIVNERSIINDRSIINERSIVNGRSIRNDRSTRNDRKVASNEMDVIESGSDPFEVTRDNQINEFIYREIDKLPTSQRTAFVLSRVEEMSQKEIAKVMIISVHAVESLLQRAKKRLKIELTPIIYENRFKK